MRSFCRGVVRSLGAAWPTLGWVLFLSLFILPHIPILGGLLAPFWFAARILLGFWWLIDLVDQELIDTFLGGSILLVFVVFVVSPGGLFFLISWLVYWSNVRRNT